MTNETTPRTLDHIKALAETIFEGRCQEPGLLPLRRFKELWRESVSTAASYIDVSEFVQANPEILTLPNYSTVGGSPRITISDTIVGAVATYVHRDNLRVATERFFKQFDGKLDDILAETADHCLRSFPSTPGEGTVARDWFNTLSGLVMAFKSPQNPEQPLEAIKLFEKFYEATTGLVAIEDANGRPIYRLDADRSLKTNIPILSTLQEHVGKLERLTTAENAPTP